MSKSSKTSLRSYGKYGTRKKREECKSLLKPYNFCCDINDRDNETHYDKRKPPFTSSLTVLSPIQESPTIKFRFQSIEPAVNSKRKGLRNKSKPKDWNLDGNPCVKTRGPLQWIQEDEIEIAKDQFWSERQKIYNEETDKNTIVGEKKVKKRISTVVGAAGPRWYQDLSIPQMKQVLALGETMTADYEETITVRTQKALTVIGVTSAFFKIAPQVIKNLHHSTKLQPVDFLREIYRRFNGQYFEEEEYKKRYDCNERIILSAIAFLGLPDAVMELNNRLPQISKPVFPPKPKPPRTPSIRHGLCKWPYEEPLPRPPDWATYRNSLDKWHKKCKLVPRPRIILPHLKGYKMNDSRNFGEKRAETPGKWTEALKKSNTSGFEDLKKGKQNEDNSEEVGTPFDLSISTLPGGDKQTFDFTISGLGAKPGPVNYKICGTLKPPFEKRKSWLGEKEAHYIVSGISEHEDPPQCPVTYVMTGISYVTPDNSDEQFLAELKLGDGPRRVYPAGRKNLSKKWQEWLQDADEEFLGVEKEANKLIKSVEATMRLVIPGNRCDACCSCRQTRKTNLKEHATKVPHMVIDSIAEGDNRKRYIVGSLAMHSPPASPAESMVNLLEVVASKETVEKKVVINGITNDSGETTYYISGVTEEIQHSPKATVLKERPPKPLRNVPPCACTIEQIFNEGKTPTASGDDIPQSKKKGICYGRKYRPEESPPFTCREYPDDKSCRRNPFDNKLKRVGKFPKPDAEIDGQPKEKRMFTLPDFEPCGDENGMAVCGGPWGAKNVSSPEVVAAREAGAKQILRARPCGSTPGRSVCGGPWGATNPSIKVRRAGEDEEEDEEEEEGEEEGEEKKLSPKELEKIAKEAEAVERKLRRQQLKRDKLCSERFDDGVTDADQSKTVEGPPVYCDYDNLWDKTRTAPTVNPWENEYEKSFGLTQPVLPSDQLKIIHNKAEGSSKRKKKESGSSGAGKNSNLNEDGDTSRNHKEQSSKTLKDNVHVIYSGKQMDRAPNSSNSNVIISQQSDAKARGPTKGNVKKSSLGSDKKLKNSEQKTPGAQGPLKFKNIEVKNKDKKIQNTKKPDKKAKPVHKVEKGNGRSNKPSTKNDCRNNRAEKWSEKETRLKKTPRNKSPNSQNAVKHKGAKSQSPSSAKEDKKTNEYKVVPAVIPDTPRLPCQRENTHTGKVSDNCDCPGDEKKTGIDDGSRKKDPFGWRTKSQQELPREKTLVYLAEPNVPVEMVKVREGGRPCNCRENRNKKKILLYNIGGAVDVSKGKRGSPRPQLIEGVTYVTPPQSPRNSSEYIPEYDLYESPYKMCVRKRSDKELKHINELATIRSLSPRKETNVESCPCGYEPEESNNNSSSKKTDEPPKAGMPESKGSRWSSAMKDEGLIDYFVSCQDAVPCWLRCAKFSKAGCCEKPKLLQVKKPVCECRYERRVVKREEEKQKWVDRQRRLRSAKKQPYLEIAGTSRPMTQDTTLIISSVKKVLRDGEFIPETEYCVSGIAENYAMGPPQQVVPGITMQSPLVTPEPSKPDILCMCGHRHWSPTDITGSPSTRPGEHYPCRGREQNKEITEIIPANKGEPLSADNSESYVAYHSCAESSRDCNADLGDRNQLASEKKRKLISDGENSAKNGIRKVKKLKFLHGDKDQSTLAAAAGNKVSEPRRAITKTNELSKASGNPRQNTTHETRTSPGNTISENKDHNSAQNTSNSDNKPVDLTELMKIELEKMASEDFILAKLPECWLIPQLQSWIEYREGKVYTDSMKKELCGLSKKRWDMMELTKKPIIPLPSLNLTQAEVDKMTFDRADEIKEKIPVIQAKYFSELRKMRVAEARSYWPTMRFGAFPNLSFKDAYFTYMPGKEADGHVFRPWKIADSK